MAKTLKTGDKLNHEGKEWTITQVGEDNEGQVVFHLKSGNDLSVIKESHLLEMKTTKKQRAPHKE